MAKQELKQKFKAKLTPQQIQYLGLLQLPSHQLQQRITEELSKNPALEALENPEEEENSTIESRQETLFGPTGSKLQGHKKRKQDAFATQAEAPITIQDRLLREVTFLPITEEEKLIARHIIGNLTERGYLATAANKIPLEIKITHDKEVTLQQVERVRKQLQKVGPPAIAAQNLQESLLLQLKAQQPTPTLHHAQQIVADHFEFFTKKRYEKLAKAIKCTPQQLQEALAAITCLRPHPIIPDHPAQAQQLHPDFLIREENGNLLLVQLHKQRQQLSIRKQYTALLDKSQQEEGPDKQQLVRYIKEQVNQARWFLDAIQKRQQTLKKILHALLESQRLFFLSGKTRDLPPLYRHHLATKIGMDPSTISRALANKALQAHRKVYSLDYFFSEPIQTTDGKEVSSHYVKERLRAIIEAEDKSKPYNDTQLQELLNAEGYLIKRRTVAKYRETLQIPIGKLRRSWLS